MKHLISLAIIALMVSCGTAQAFNPYEEQFNALQEQIDQLQNQVDEFYDRSYGGLTDEVMYHKKMHYYMPKPLCPATPPPNVPDDAWFCSNEAKRPGKIDITYSPWTYADLYGPTTQIEFQGTSVANMIAYVTVINQTGSFATVQWGNRIQWGNASKNIKKRWEKAAREIAKEKGITIEKAILSTLFVNESRVYRFIWTVVPDGNGGYDSIISGRVISQNFRE